MAVAAHINETQASADRSRDPRRRLRLETEGALPGGEPANVLVHNLSATGLLIETTIPLALDERIEIELPHAGSSRAKVIWTSDRLFGCQFETPISAAALSAAELRSFTPRQFDVATGADEALPARLARLRRTAGLTLAEIATRLGVSKPTVWAWEQGKSRPAESRIDALAEALGVTRADLLPGPGVGALQELLARSRNQIARTVGVGPDKVRIMIEL